MPFLMPPLFITAVEDICVSGSSGLLKVIYLSLLPPNFEKVKAYFPRKGICLSFLWKK